MIQPDTPEVTISIVNSGNRELVGNCLSSIYENTNETSFEIVIVDNCSGDGSVEMLRERFPEVKQLFNTERKGFSANHNQVMRVARGRWVLLLNDDTLVMPGAIDKMAAHMRGNPEIGLLGCRIENPDGSLQISCFRPPSLTELFCDAFLLSNLLPWFTVTGGYRKWPHDSLREVPFVSGAAMLFPREIINTVGYLDERFVIYAEDADWSKRIRDAGLKVVFMPDARIIHFGGSSVGLPGYDAFHNSHRSRVLYFLKHSGPLAVGVAAALDIIGAAIRVLFMSAAYPFAFSRRKIVGERIIYFARRIAWYLATPLKSLDRRPGGR